MKPSYLLLKENLTKFLIEIIVILQIDALMLKSV
jgi:hypothetical protein